MFGLGLTEIVVIVVVALLVLGPKHLPEAARTAGRTVGMLRRTLDELKHEMTLPPLDLDHKLPKRKTLLDTEDSPVKKTEPKVEE